MKNDYSGKAGYVYVLTSSNTTCVKIGGTGIHPMKRLREINSTEPYKRLGPWTLADFHQVSDWRDVEYRLHYVLRDRLNQDVDGQRELFSVCLTDASRLLEGLDPEEMIGKPKVGRMFMNEAFRDYLLRLFRFAGLSRWIDEQGIWTLSIFSSTMGGRYFTVNIGMHEVAFSTLPKQGRPQVNMIYMDKLIMYFPATMAWINEHNGSVSPDAYESALDHGASVLVEGDFDTMAEFMSQSGVRRAILAYWSESLITLKEQGRLSLFAKHHGYNAVATLKKLLDAEN